MKNFLLRFLLPPALPVVVVALTIAAFNWNNPNQLGGILLLALYALLMAYLIAGLPALLFAIIMTRLQTRGFRHGGVRLLTAALLGLGAGFAIGLVFRNTEALIGFMPIGLVVGLLVELTVVVLERINHHPTTR